MKKRNTRVNYVDIRQQVKTVSVYMNTMNRLFIMEENTNASTVTIRQLRKVISLDISSHFMRVGNILVTNVSIRQLRKVTLLDISGQFMRVGDISVDNVNTRQLGKVILLLISCLFMQERSTNVANAIPSLPCKQI
jgi:hypothetical protein